MEDNSTTKNNGWRLQSSSTVKTAQLITKNAGSSHEDNPRNIISRSSTFNNYPNMHFASKGVLPNNEKAPSLPKRRPRSHGEILQNIRDYVYQTPETCVDSGIQTDQAVSTGLPNDADSWSTNRLPTLRNEAISIHNPKAVKSSEQKNVVPPLIPSNNNNNHMIMFNHLG